MSARVDSLFSMNNVFKKNNRIVFNKIPLNARNVKLDIIGRMEPVPNQFT